MKNELSANSVLSHYRIVSKLRARGLGELWLAEDTRLKRKVALKLLPAELTSDTEAIALSEKSLQSDPTNQIHLRIAGYAYAKSGRQREAEQVIGRFKAIAQTQYVVSYSIASIYAALGAKDKAFAELERAFAERDWDMHHLNGDPLMDPLRDDPRFKDLVRRIGLPE